MGKKLALVRWLTFLVLLLTARVSMATLHSSHPVQPPDESASVAARDHNVDRAGDEDGDDDDDDDDDDDNNDGIDEAESTPTTAVPAPGSIAKKAKTPNAESLEIAGNLTLASDYILRGFTQTGHRPALQGGFDYESPSGFYLGVWGSNVYFPEDDLARPSLELDYSGGYQYQFNLAASKASVRLGLMYADYFDDANRCGVNVPLRFEYLGWSAEIDYSPNWQGVGQSWYFLIGYAHKLPLKLKVAASIGYAIVDGDEAENYPDAEIDLSRKFFKVDFQIAAILVQTQTLDEAQAGSRLVFSANQAF